jgi:hypothetical protein
MSEVIARGRLKWRPGLGDWALSLEVRTGRLRDHFWTFARRIDAVAFARRKGIRLVTE